MGKGGGPMSKRPLTHSLEKWLDGQVLRQDAGALKPLPATRALGEKFGISHGTVFRLLARLEKEGKVWRHANGRIYPALAGKVLGRAKPLAVMLRRMLAWSSLCREVMEGFTDECGERDRPILLFHNRNLMVQEMADSGLKVASNRSQKEMLREFVLLHGDSVGGVLFDEVWRDESIREALPPEVAAVSFSRASVLPQVGSVAADFKAGALLAMSHLLASGYEKILLVDPLPDYEPARRFLKLAAEVHREISGRELPGSRIVELHSADQRREFLRKLAGSKTRTGLICPEDNLSLSLAREMRAAAIPLGRLHGLVSVMGTSAIAAGDISCVRYDYRAMGHAAAAMLCEGRTESRLFAPVLDVGSSTVGGR